MPRPTFHQISQSSSSQELQIQEGEDYIGLTKRLHPFLESSLLLKVESICTPLMEVQ